MKTKHKTKNREDMALLVREIPPTDLEKVKVGYAAYRRGMTLIRVGKIEQGVGDLKNAIIFLDRVDGLSNIHIPIANKAIQKAASHVNTYSGMSVGDNVKVPPYEQSEINQMTNAIEEHLELLLKQRKELEGDGIKDYVLRSQPLEDDPQYSFGE